MLYFKFSILTDQFANRLNLETLSAEEQKRRMNKFRIHVSNKISNLRK